MGRTVIFHVHSLTRERVVLLVLVAVLVVLPLAELLRLAHFYRMLTAAYGAADFLVDQGAIRDPIAEGLRGHFVRWFGLFVVGLWAGGLRFDSGLVRQDWLVVPRRLRWFATRALVLGAAVGILVPLCVVASLFLTHLLLPDQASPLPHLAPEAGFALIGAGIHGVVTVLLGFCAGVATRSLVGGGAVVAVLAFNPMVFALALAALETFMRTLFGWRLPINLLTLSRPARLGDDDGPSAGTGIPPARIEEFAVPFLPAPLSAYATQTAYLEEDRGQTAWGDAAVDGAWLAFFLIAACVSLRRDAP